MFSTGYRVEKNAFTPFKCHRNTADRLVCWPVWILLKHFYFINKLLPLNSQLQTFQLNKFLV